MQVASKLLSTPDPFFELLYLDFLLRLGHRNRDQLIISETGRGLSFWDGPCPGRPEKVLDDSLSLRGQSRIPTVKFKIPGKVWEQQDAELLLHLSYSF